MNLLSNNITNWKICEFGKLVIKPTEKLDPKTHAEFRCVELEHIEQDVGWINGYANSNNLSSVKNKFYVGDTLFGKLRPYLKKYWHAEFDGGCSSEIWVLRANQSLMDSKYLFYFVQSNRFIQATNVTSGSKMPRADWSFVSNLPFPVPSLPEQQKIVEILSTWDQAIKTTQKLIDQLKLRNKGLAQQLLTGKKRLKGFEGEWEEVTLKDIADRITRKNDELDDTVVTISAQRGFVLQEDFFTKRVASETLSNYYLIHEGEFAYNKSYSNGYPMGAFKRLDRLEKAVVTTLYICFSLKKNVNSDFMNHFFEAGLMIRPLMKIAQEGGRAHGLLNIGIHDFFGLKLTIPTLKEQEAITSVLSEADKELKLLQQQLATLKEQKKGLLQKLLTGEIRVKID